MIQDSRITAKNLKKTLIVKSGEEVNLETVSVFDQPDQKGEVEIKAVVMDEGKLNLKGIIKIKKGAINADAFLRQKVLALGNAVAVVVEPILEIECNEVKASHAVSIGRLDEEQIFYLMSRGMERQEAEELLVKAFLNE